MDGYFYAQSMHSTIETEVPSGFLKIEQAFRSRVPRNVRPDMVDGLGPFVQLAENVCRRMGDVEYYAHLVRIELEKKEGTFSAKATSTLLVGFFAACKSVLDSIAITLARVFRLGIKTLKSEVAPKQMDFARQGKGSFWSLLASEQNGAFNRYNKHSGTMGEIIKWRDASIHRVHPLVITTMEKDVATDKYNVKGYELADEFEGSQGQILDPSTKVKWRDPLYFFYKWRPRLIELCNEACSDIVEQESRRIIAPSPIEAAIFNARRIEERMGDQDIPR